MASSLSNWLKDTDFQVPAMADASDFKFFESGSYWFCAVQSDDRADSQRFKNQRLELYLSLFPLSIRAATPVRQNEPGQPANNSPKKLITDRQGGANPDSFEKFTAQPCHRKPDFPRNSTRIS